MNRDIKFRGKRFDNGEWAYGNLIIDDSGNCEIVDYENNHEIRYDVRGETIGQFTGMKDRKGKEIYEGDIINWLSFTFGGQGFVEEGHVEWRQVEGCYVVVNRIKTKDGRESIQLLIRCTRDLKVVGNIYDNHELLKGGKDE